MKKRLALVTGGTRGIGRAISIALKQAGYHVAANYGSNDHVAKSFEIETGIACFKWDVSNYNVCEEGVGTIEEHFGQPIDILINNAGITRDAMLHKSTFDDWNAVLHTNLTSCYIMCRLTVPGMRERGFGRIVNISSINAQTGQLGQTNYAAAKAGLLGFTKSLALESANKSITVNAVAPGYIKTEMLDAMPAEAIAKLSSLIPVGQLGTPHDIARAVLFLVSEESGFITGETLSVNGGHSMV
jgi:acetoacetyl-CoA reductase